MTQKQIDYNGSANCKPKDIDAFLEVFREYWRRVPDWRFGQLVENVMRFPEKSQDGRVFVEDGDWQNKLFFIEDEEFARQLEEFFKGIGYGQVDAETD